jgi:hypothetical protein
MTTITIDRSYTFLLDSSLMIILNRFQNEIAVHSIHAIFLPANHYIAMGVEDGCVKIWGIMAQKPCQIFDISKSASNGGLSRLKNHFKE